MENNFFTPFTQAIGDSIRQFASGLMGDREHEQGLYQSRWGDINDGFLSESHDGIRFGDLALSEDISMRHALCLAPSGVGKTSTVVINTALGSCVGQSYIIHSEADDVFQKTSGYFKSKGYEVYKLDLGGDPQHTNHYNAFDFIAHSSDYPKLAQLVFGSQEKTSDPFWIESAQGLGACLFTCVGNMDYQYRNLGFVNKMITWLGSEPQKVDELMAKYADSQTLDNFKYYISMPEKTFGSILAQCKSSMRLYDDPNVVAITSDNDMPIDLRSKRTVVYLKNNLHNAKYVSPILGIYLHQVTKSLMQEIDIAGKIRPVYCILDESVMLSRALSNLGILMTQGRKYRLSFLVVAQNIDLLKKYEDYDAILSNAYSKVYFNSLDNKTSEYVSTTLGRTMTKDAKGNERVTPLYTPEQVRQMIHNQVIILSGNRNAYKVVLKPYYKQFILNMRSKIPPVNISSERKKSLN